MSVHRLRLCFHTVLETHTFQQGCLEWVTVYERRTHRCVLWIIKRTQWPVEIDRKLIWPRFALFIPVVSFCDFDRRNKQIRKKKRMEGWWWGSGGVHGCVIFPGKASYSAVGLHSCQVIWGFCACVLFSLKCPRKYTKMRKILYCGD